MRILKTLVAPILFFVTPMVLAQEISGIATDRDVLIGAGSTANATVSISSPQNSATTVTLSCSSIAVHVPSTVTIPVGQTSATATVQSLGASTIEQVQIGAKIGTSTSAACSLANIPNSSSLSNFFLLSCDASKNGNIIRFSDWSADVVSATLKAQVYRRVTGQTSETSLGQAFTGVYVDSQAPTGQSVQYQVRLTDSSTNSVISQTDWSAGTTRPSTGMALSWVNPPSPAVAQIGDIEMQVHPSSTLTDAIEVLVDGRIVVTTGMNSSYSSPVAGDYSFELNTDRLGTGLHRVQVITVFQGTPSATPAILVKTGNSVNILSESQTIEGADNMSDAFTFDIDNSASTYTVTISNDGTGSTVRTYSGSIAQSLLIGSRPHRVVAWDLNDSSGVRVGAGDYTASVSVTNSSGTTIKKHKVKYVTSAPQILYLYNEESATNGTIIATSNSIKNSLVSMATAYGMTAVMYSGTRTQDKPTMLKIRKWLKNNVTVFGFEGHGSAGVTAGTGAQLHWQGMVFLANPITVMTRSGLQTVDDATPRYFSFSYELNGRPLHFAFLDGCYSAGYDEFGPECYSATSYLGTWYTAMNMSSGDCVLGWSGNASQNINSSGGETLWARWRRSFWYFICAGGTVDASWSYANSHCAPPEYFTPWNPQVRLFAYGDDFSCTIP